VQPGNPIPYERLIDGKNLLNDALADIRYWSERVMGWREAMPDSYDPELAVAASVRLREAVLCFRLVHEALRSEIPAHNEHEEYATRLRYDRRARRYTLDLLPN
jgi:hypothetical protein